MIQDAINIAAEMLIKPFEGYAKQTPDGGCSAYPDPGTGGSPWTIGWGSTGPDINPTTVWTLQQAEISLKNHLTYFTTGLLKLSPTLVSASDRRVAALISFVYNCGLGNYRISTLKRRVDAADWGSAASEILKWNKAAGRVLPGLTKRRTAEAMLLR
jgi:GH24 family phage-related lysozyme (muramidase)